MPYSPVSITGYNANPPEDDGSVTESNEIAWQKHLDKIGAPLKTAIESTQTAISTIIDELEAKLRPVGTVVDYAGTTAPAGWLFIFGQAVSRSTYSELFARLGTTYGVGNGSTTFNLPDGRGRVLAGKDDMGGANANRLNDASGGVNGDLLGAAGGAETRTLVTGNVPSYNLQVAAASSGITGAVGTAISNGDAIVRGTSRVSAQTGGGLNDVPDNTSVSNTIALANGGVTFGGTITIPSGGSGTAFGLVQPTLILNKIIWTGVLS